MTDYNKILEQIKVSEVRVELFSKEIKDVEAEIKKLEGETEVMSAKEEQLKDELSYKYKIVNEKEWELQSLKRKDEIWKTIIEEKRNVFQKVTEELANTQQQVWNTRITFGDKTLDFLTKNNFLLNIDNLENMIKKKEEKKKMTDLINKIENDLKTLEKEHIELKNQYDLFSHLEKEKETLLEYEYSFEILRLQNKIDYCNKELEDLENELLKYNDKATMPNFKIAKLQKSQCSKDNSNKLPGLNESHYREELNDETVYLENREGKKLFKPKVPSFLLKRN